MRTIRRLYVYVVAFISLEVVLWGSIGLARTMFAGDQIGIETSQLAGSLSLVFVGVPVFLLHWWLAQRNISDPDERFARLRALFVYAALLSTLIPVAQNILALVNRLWLTTFGVSTRMAFIGEGQTWIDNLIAILLNGLLAAYFFSVERADWEASPQGDAYPEMRRLYRYIWVIYSLVMLVAGVQQVLRFILNLVDTIGESTQAELANGLALLIVGTPLWVYVWQQVVRKSLAESGERNSSLRIFVLYTISLVGVGGVLVPAGIVLDTILNAILGQAMTLGDFVTEISEPLSAAIPFGGVWAYYGRILTSEVDALPDTPRRAGLRRLYFYILAFVGLAATVFGIQALFSFIIDALLRTFPWGITLRTRLSSALATLLVSLPLWVLTWRPMIAQAAQQGETGDHARRSLIRKTYLYLTLFAGVIGVMVSAGSLVFQLVSKLLGDPPENFQRASWMLLEMLVVFTGLLAYHWVTLRKDGREADRSLAARHAGFPVTVLVPEMGAFSEEIVSALRKETPSLPVSVCLADEIPEGALANSRSLILPGELAANPPAELQRRLQRFAETKIVVPTPSENWLWTFGSGRPLSSLASQTAKMVRHLAEGEEIPKIREVSGWTILLYILGALIGIPLVISLFSLLAEILYS